MSRHAHCCEMSRIFLWYTPGYKQAGGEAEHLEQAKVEKTDFHMVDMNFCQSNSSKLSVDGDDCIDHEVKVSIFDTEYFIFSILYAMAVRRGKLHME